MASTLSPSDGPKVGFVCFWAFAARRSSPFTSPSAGVARPANGREGFPSNPSRSHMQVARGPAGSPAMEARQSATVPRWRPYEWVRLLRMEFVDLYRHLSALQFSPASFLLFLRKSLLSTLFLVLGLSSAVRHGTAGLAALHQLALSAVSVAAYFISLCCSYPLLLHFSCDFDARSLISYSDPAKWARVADSRMFGDVVSWFSHAFLGFLLRSDEVGPSRPRPPRHSPPLAPIHSWVLYRIDVLSF